MLSFCEFFLSFEAHSRNSTSAAKALCATESSTWPCDIWGLVFTAFETAFLCRLPSCTVTRTILWFFLFFCIFFLFFKACLSFLSTLLGSLKVLAKFCLMNNEWTDGVGIHKLRNLASPSPCPEPLMCGCRLIVWVSTDLLMYPGQLSCLFASVK